MLDEFREKMRERENALLHKMNTRNTTPEDHGERLANSIVRLELSIRMRLAAKGELAEGWQEALIQELRKAPLEELYVTRADKAEYRYIVQLADELECIFLLEAQ